MGSPANNLGRNGSKTHIFFLMIMSTSCPVFKVADDGLICGQTNKPGGFSALCTSPSILGGFFIWSHPWEEVRAGGRCHPGSLPAYHHTKTCAGEETRGMTGPSLLTPMCPHVPPHLGNGGGGPATLLQTHPQPQFYCIPRLRWANPSSLKGVPGMLITIPSSVCSSPN